MILGNNIMFDWSYHKAFHRFVSLFIGRLLLAVLFVNISTASQPSYKDVLKGVKVPVSRVVNVEENRATRTNQVDIESEEIDYPLVYTYKPAKCYYASTTYGGYIYKGTLLR